MNKQRESPIPGGRPRSTSVFFYHELPQIASCSECVVLVPLPNITQKKKEFFKWRKSEQTLHSFGSCIILLLEYNSDEDVVNFAECEDQTPLVTLNLNRIVQKTLKHKDLKFWQEFHLNDKGKKRSFVLQFSKGPEFDKFYQKLKEVVKVLKSCKDGKSVVDKKYYLVGYKQKEEQEQIQEIALVKRNSDSGSISSFSSDNSVNSVKNLECDYIPPPFCPIPFRALNSNRVSGLEEALLEQKLQRNRSQSESAVQKKHYEIEIYGSLQKPTPSSDILNSKCDSGIVFLSTCDDPEWTIKKTLSNSNFDGDETIKKQPKSLRKLSNTEEGSFSSWEVIPSVKITEIDKDQNRNSDDCEFLYSVNIKDIDSNKDRTLVYSGDFIRSVNIADIDLDHTFKEGDINNQLCDFNCDGDLNETMKARQEQNQLKQYAQLLQTAINDGDQENARQYADILAASHVKVAIMVDENSLKEETNDQDIKIKVFIEDKESVGGSLLLSVKLTDTIGELKAKMFYKHKFPMEVQKWIVGKRIPRDDETLQKLRVTNGQTVFLYLVSAKSVGLDKQQHLKATSGYVDMTLVEHGARHVMPTLHYNTQQQPLNQLSGTPPKQPVKIDKPVLGAVADLQPENYVPVPVENQTQRQESDNNYKLKKSGSETDNKQVGWQCPACTFLNLPTRPGCEMCSYPRPKEYKIPEDYKMSKEEVERIKREEEDERKAQQAAAERRAREREPAENIYNKMTEQEIHQLLTLNDQMQQQLQQSRQTGGQEHEFNDDVQIPRGQQPENLENIPFVLPPVHNLDFSQENDDSV